MDEGFKRLVDSYGGYCPFEALRAGRVEIRHSNFLADILSPNNSHKFRDSILREFLKKLSFQGGLGQSFGQDIISRDLSKAEIRREWKNIDLLIRLPAPAEGGEKELVIAIEVKVESEESGTQLEKYTKTLEHAYPNACRHFFFLTMSKKNPSHPEWKPISFSLISSAMEEGLNKISGDPLANAMAKSYISLLRRQDLENDRDFGIVENLLDSHREALIYLEKEKQNQKEKSIQEIVQSIRSDDFINKINARLKKAGNKKIVLAEQNNTYTTFRIEGWPDYMPVIGFETRLGGILGVSMTLVRPSLSNPAAKPLYRKYGFADSAITKRIGKQKMLRSKAEMIYAIENQYALSITEKEEEMALNFIIEKVSEIDSFVKNGDAHGKKNNRK